MGIHKNRLKEKIFFISVEYPEVSIPMQASGYSTEINCEVFKMMDLKNKVKDIAIDINSIRYYVTKDAYCVNKGIKNEEWNFLR